MATDVIPEVAEATLPRSKHLLDLRSPEVVAATETMTVKGFKVSDLAKYNKAIFAAIITIGLSLRLLSDKQVTQEDVNTIIASVVTTAGVFAIANKPKE